MASTSPITIRAAPAVDSPPVWVMVSRALAKNASNTDSGPFSFINRQLFITEGNTDSFVLREKLHVEKTPNGEFVVILDTLSIECRG